MRIRKTRCLIEAGDQFFFNNLRTVENINEVISHPYREPVWGSERIITVLSISVDGKVAYRIDMPPTLEIFEEITSSPPIWSGMDEYRGRADATISDTYLHVAEKLIEDHVWYYVADAKNLGI